MLSTDYLRFAFALALVLGLIALFAWLVKRFRIGSLGGAMNGRGRLQVVESLTIDGRQRLVMIRRDDQEHLLLLGPETGQVIEANIDRERQGTDLEVEPLPGVRPLAGAGS